MKDARRIYDEMHNNYAFHYNRWRTDEAGRSMMHLIAVYLDIKYSGFTVVLPPEIIKQLTDSNSVV
jgi:hypothetical protein